MCTAGLKTITVREDAEVCQMLGVFVFPSNLRYDFELISFRFPPKCSTHTVDYPSTQGSFVSAGHAAVHVASVAHFFLHDLGLRINLGDR